MSVWTDFIISVDGSTSTVTPEMLRLACLESGVYIFDLTVSDLIHKIWTCGSKQSAGELLAVMRKLPWAAPEWVVVMWRSDCEDCGTWHMERLTGEHHVSSEILG